MLTEPAYWIIVGSPANFKRSRELGFTVQGIKSRHRKRAEKMQPGDRLAYYLTGLKVFGGIATITSRYFESHERVWSSDDPGKAAEDYPFRVYIKPDHILEIESYIDAEPIARQMEYARKWPAANWTLAFQGNVHAIPEGDFRLIEQAIVERSGHVVA